MKLVHVLMVMVYLGVIIAHLVLWNYLPSKILAVVIMACATGAMYFRICRAWPERF